MTDAEKNLIVAMLGPDYADAGEHPIDTCSKADCLICGVIDCPSHEPLHYDKDGCPACTVPVGSDPYGGEAG